MRAEARKSNRKKKKKKSMKGLHTTAGTHQIIIQILIFDSMSSSSSEFAK